MGSFAKLYELSILGENGVLQTIYGNWPYTSEKWITIFNLFKDMQDNNFFTPSLGIMNMTNNEAEKEFSLRKVARIFGGSWALPMYIEGKEKINLDVFLPPPVSKEVDVKSFIDGRTYFYVNKASVNRQKAIDFLKWLTQQPQQILLAQETLSIPANKKINKGLPKILNVFYENMKSVYPSLAKQESWQVTNYFNTNLQAIVVGGKSPIEAAKNMQVEKEKQLRN